MMRWLNIKKSDFFIPDVRKVTKRLKVEQRANLDGQNDQPESNDSTLQGTQFEIVHYFKELHRRVHRNLLDQWSDTRDVGREIDVNDVMIRLNQIPSQCAEKINEIKSRHEGKAALLEDAQVREGQNYEQFRDQNGLRRTAKYPKHQLGIVVFLIALLAVDASVVYWFLRRSADSTVLLTVQRSAIIAALNVLLPLMFVSGFRYVNHTSIGKRIFGWLSGGLSVTVIAVLGMLVVSHFPGQSLFGLLTGLQAELSEVSLLSLPIDGVVQWSLFGLVNAVGLLAFLIGYLSDDVYPHYGGMQRSFHNSVNRRLTLKGQVADQIRRTILESKRKIKREIGKLKKQITGYAKRVDTYDASLSGIEQYRSALEDNCNIVLARYRAVNRKARETEAPTSFENWFCFGPDEEIQPASADFEKARLTKFDAALKEIEVLQPKLEAKLMASNEVSEGVIEWDGAAISPVDQKVAAH